MVPCSGCRCPQADPEAPQAWIREIFFSDRNAKQIAPQECVGQDASDDARCPRITFGTLGVVHSRSGRGSDGCWSGSIVGRCLFQGQTQAEDTALERCRFDVDATSVMFHDHGDKG